MLLLLIVITLLASSAFAKPVGTSLERLEVLKAKLRGLEEELSTYDVQKPLDESFLNADPVHVDSNNEAKKQLLPPDVGDTFEDFLSTLSEAERNLLRKMNTKLHLLKDALTAPALEQDGSVPATSVNDAKEKRGFLDVPLKEFLDGLSPEDRAKVTKVESKLKHLLSSLTDKASGDPLDVISNEAVPERRGLFDQPLQDFLNKLGTKDRTVVNKLKSKLKYLLAALTERSATDPLDVESKVPTRRGVALPPASIHGLSAGDQQVALRHASRLPLLKKALQETTGANEADKNGGSAKRELEQSVTDKDLQDFIESLSDMEAEILKKYDSHLGELEQAVHEKRQENPEDKFGEFVQSKVDTKPGVHWGSRPSLENELGLIEDPERRCAGGKCPVQKPAEKRCVDGKCSVKKPSVSELARRIAAELRASKGDSITLSDVVKKVQEARLRMRE